MATTIKPDIRDIFRTLSPVTRAYMFLKMTHGTFSNIDQMLFLSVLSITYIINLITTSQSIFLPVYLPFLVIFLHLLKYL